MKIIATADLHGRLPSIPECDVLIIAGDVCPDDSVAFQRSWLETNFTSWLEEQPARYILGIAGNHDFALERYPNLARSLPWTYLLDESVSIEGLKYYGIPWVPNLSRWAFHLDDAGLDHKYNAIPNDIDIVISHGPPYLNCDYTVPMFRSVHCGAPHALDMLERVNPLFFICGHIHEGFGQVRYKDTLVTNVAYMDETYKKTRHPVHLWWQNDTIFADLQELPIWCLEDKQLEFIEAL